MLLPAVLTALAYVGAGQLALLLAIPPSYAAPIYPPAGIALAVVLVYGYRALPGVLAGAFFVNALLAHPRGLPPMTAQLLALAIAIGATAQAGVGAWLVRRRSSSRALAEPRDVLAFCLYGAVLACLLNASIATTALSLLGVLPAEARAFTWWTWWAGDTLGVLIGAPTVLSLIGRPRADWAPRRVALALPLMAALSLLALATVQVTRLDQLRGRAVFEQSAAAAADTISSHLQQALFALQATHGLFLASNEVSRDELRRVAEPWLALPISLQAIGYSERVARSDFADYEARVSASDGRSLRIFERRERGTAPISAQDVDGVVMRFVEPFDRNASALGVNVLSIPAAREAIGRAARGDQATASAGFRLTQEVGDQTGVVLYRALYRGEPGPAERAEALRGVVFVTLRMDQSLAAAMKEQPGTLRWCLVDIDPSATRPRLAGPQGCDNAAPDTHEFQRTLNFAGRQWRVRIAARAADFAEGGHVNAWLFSTAGLLSTALLAVLLLTVTGRTRRIESAVAQRTAELEREMGERARTEQALRESEQRLRNILDHAPIGILYADLQGRVREANPKFRDMLGYAADALAGKSIAELTPEEDRADDAELLVQLLRGEAAPLRRRKRLERRDGQPVWVQMILSVLRDASGQPQRLVAVVEDITEHLRLLEAERGRDLAESANRAKSEFLSRMSHELRTPLNAMLGFAQLLELDRQPALAGHQREWTAQIQHAGWHLLEMINDILDLSRIESGMIRLDTVAIDAAPLLRSCIAMVQPSAAQRGIQVREHIEPGTRAVMADPTRLKQVLTNLLSNAVKYNVDQGRVDVEVQAGASGMVEVRVTDSGLGLSETQMAELFQPFNRLGREHSQIEGTGIGLVISRRLAELMGGGLQAHSQEGQGSTFVLSLPAAAGQVGPDAAAGLIDPLSAPYRRRQVHYVEDNETNAEVMRGILAQRPQVEMTVSASGLDGLAAIRMSLPDLILLDMHLPDIDGLELLRHLKHDLRTADVPIVVVSADATPARINEAIAAGAAHYLTKPLNLGTFLALVDGLLGEMDTRFG
ncbi:CHASE domain-containing protein [Aquabacterium sp.]|uniref:CHASE domain-containing protein n=1 Tax=Aquabacterium sp. TaxID=1872578 RepID=UPI002D19E285|nr:CHASE domain-containing protein [Aquabacterium sp.]HSW03374.1 CHASE domain-containing protein [Aquabacterium sp.]